MPGIRKGEEYPVGNTGQESVGESCLAVLFGNGQTASKNKACKDNHARHISAGADDPCGAEGLQCLQSREECLDIDHKRAQDVHGRFSFDTQSPHGYEVDPCIFCEARLHPPVCPDKEDVHFGQALSYGMGNGQCRHDVAAGATCCDDDLHRRALLETERIIPDMNMVDTRVEPP